jgi:hypothetical protein
VPQWPQWWDWELEFSSHVLKRMGERGFNEVDVRTMLTAATAYRSDVVPERWIIETRLRRRPWEVIVEPDLERQVNVVVTAYPADA